MSYEQYMVTVTGMSANSRRRRLLDRRRLVEIGDLTEDNYYAFSAADSLTLSTVIDCFNNEVDGSSCDFIIGTASLPTFAQNVSSLMGAHFNNSEVVFAAVADEASLSIVDKYATTTEVDWFTIVVLSGCGLMSLLAVPALLHNKRRLPKLPGFHYVDDGKFVALILYALQIWDFYSDLNLAIFIVQQPQFPGNMGYLVSGVLSTTFTIIPYTSNLIMAIRIKDFVRTNAAAKGWFQANTAIFAMLTALSGGCHAALSLVSSGIFGLQMLTSGLTQYELKQMSKFKVIGTVAIENVPQLACQVIYTMASGGTLESTVILAAGASLLSVIATTLSYLIGRDDDNTKVVQYYISTECLLRGKEEDDSDDRRVAVAGSTGIIDASNQGREDMGSNAIDEIEKLNFINNRGRTKALAEHLAECYHISPKNIEVGFSTISKYGATTHIVHYVYDEDLAEMQQHQPDLGIASLARLYCHQLYRQHAQDIGQVFRAHFQLNRDFVTSFHNKATKRTEEATLQSLRQQRQSDVLFPIDAANANATGTTHTAQSIKDSLTSWFKHEGITLAGDQMVRLNEYFIRPESQQQRAPTRAAWEELDGGGRGRTGGGADGQIVSHSPSLDPMATIDAMSEQEAHDMLDDILPQVNLEQNTETGSVHIEHAY